MVAMTSPKPEPLEMETMSAKKKMTKLDELASAVAKENGCGGTEKDRWCWGEKDNCSCRNEAKERFAHKKGQKGEPERPLRVFDENGTIEILDARGRVVIKWTGFEASDFGIVVQRRMAKQLVTAANKVKP